MKKLGIAVAATIGLGGFAHAADLPTTKPPAAPPPANCFSSLWTYLNSTAAECPLSYAGFTLYVTLDGGLGYNTNGAAWNPAYPQAVNSFVTKQSNGTKWLFTPNGINQSVIGIAMSEPIPWFPNWSLVGTVEAGLNSPLDASTAALAPGRKTSFRRSSTIGRSSGSTSTLA